MALVLSACTDTSKQTNKQENNSSKKIKALIVDGQNNHGIWPKTTIMMKEFLLETNLFEVDIKRMNYTWQGPHSKPPTGIEDITELISKYTVSGMETKKVVEEPEVDKTFSPKFTDYDVVISNLGWKTAVWPEDTQRSFEKYMREGGGLVIVHAANNAWPEWEEFNKMIGVGGWADRNTKNGDAQLFFDKEGNMQKQTEESACGSHGPEMEFIIENRAPSHPIMQGIPNRWLHTKDELYERLCGPAENVTVLATAFSDAEGNSPPWDPKVKGANRSEPILLTVEYGEGRTFHSTLGHSDYSMECVGFISTFTRGCEWAATGSVTLPLPENFPTEEETQKKVLN